MQVSYRREGEKVYGPLTALFLGLVRSVLAVFDRVAHFGAIDALAILTQELLGSLTSGGCREKSKDTISTNTLIETLDSGFSQIPRGPDTP